MHKRKLVSIAIAFAFLILAATGVLMYIFPYEQLTASIHTFFGMAFILVAGLHLKSNWMALKNYSREKKKEAALPFTKAFMAVVLVALLLLTGLYAEFPPVSSVYAWGNAFRNEQLGKSTQMNEYEHIQLQQALGDAAVAIEVKKGAAFQYPLFAVWAEDLEGNYVQTLYVSRSIATSVFKYGKKEGEQWEPAVLRRPEALPRWSHKRGIQAADGYHLPSGGTADVDLDGYSGATPHNNFIVSSKLQQKSLETVRIFFEVNQSYDWNEYYSKDRFPEDTIYSGSGKVGQPALVYTTVVDLKRAGKKDYLLEPLGHSHHSGATGELFPDFTNITTALEIVDRIILTVDQGTPPAAPPAGEKSLALE
jgi:hypothetical protein